MNNPEGQLPLINEWVCSQMASKFMLAMPESGICLVSQNAQLGEEFAKSFNAQREFSSRNFGLAFFSTYIAKSVPLVPKLIGMVPKEQLAKLVLFDHIVYNKDRHKGNILLAMEKAIKLYAIDHSHVFKNQCIWDQYTFSQGMRENDYLDTDILRFNNDVYKAVFDYSLLDVDDFTSQCSFAQAELTPEFLHSIIEQIPRPWIQGRIQDIHALEKYLVYRIAHLNLTNEVIVKEGGLYRG